MLRSYKKILRVLLVITIISSMFVNINYSFASDLAAGLVLDYSANMTFNGTSDYIDKTSDISLVSGLTQGSITAKFKSTSTAVAKTLFSVSHTADQSSNMTLALNNGTVHFENRENDIYATNMNTTASTYNDGNWHTVVLTVDNTGTKIYMDRTLNVSSAAATKFFANVLTMNGMWIGKNVDNTAGVTGQWYYAGDIAFVKVHNRALTAAEAQEISGMTYTGNQYKSPTVTVLGKGIIDSNSYRIPSLLTTMNNTVILGCDQRIPNDNDSPYDINAAIKRSTNGGKTWGNLQVLVDYPGTLTDGSSAIDPSVLQDTTTGTIFMMFDHFPGAIGAHPQYRVYRKNNLNGV